MDIVSGNESCTEDLDVVHEEVDMWPPDLDKDEYQWPNLVGTAEEKVKMIEPSVKYKPLFGLLRLVAATCENFTTLTKNPDGSDMQPKPHKCRPVTP